MTDKYAGRTEGEWVVVTPASDFEPYAIGQDGIQGGNDVVAEVYDEANARLIADAPKLLEENKRLREALEKLACLGNGDRWGNSIGNEIAQKALKESEDE